ncbi:MAG: hypothetical protein U1E65_18390 [Myxococcota bacterium]
MSSLRLFSLVSLCFWAAPTLAQEGPEGLQQQEEYLEDVATPEQMEDEAPPPAAQPAPGASDQLFDVLMQQNMAPADTGGATTLSYTTPAPMIGTVSVPLKNYVELRDRAASLAKKRGRPVAPMVTLGAAEYSGEARSGALSLKVALDVTLGHAGLYKVVPLIGDDIVLVRAEEGGQPIPVTRQNGYHAWITDRAGEARIVLEILVPARGPRGSIEYDFRIPRTPVTRFACSFPTTGLEPEIDAAVHRELKSREGHTDVSAILAPTTRVHLVGFRDLGETETRETKVYAESSSLVSINRGYIDVFTVIHYTILYGGIKDFAIRIPQGTKVLAADGQGAFRYALDESEGLLKGETAFPIRTQYEISLRLRRELKSGAEPTAFLAPIPRPEGVERDQGWLGVEVPGKLKLEEQKREEALAVDVRQLPSEVLDSAVSPILKAYRYHSRGAAVGLVTTELPEKEPSSAAIDRIRAFSVVSAEGKVLTDVKITLKNRLRPALLLTLPKDTELRSSLLDGDPVKPSKNEKGQLMLPLRRSKNDREPFTLELVLESSMSGLGLFGQARLALPAVDLPISSLAWSVSVPAKNTYSSLRGAFAPQLYAGEGRWHRPVTRRGSRGEAAANAPVTGLEAGTEEAPASADTGAMPVRIRIPEGGVRLEYAGYWMDDGNPVVVSLWYLSTWLLAPIGLLLLLGVAGLCVPLLSAVRSKNVYGLALLPVIALLAALLAKVGGGALVVLAALLGFGADAATQGRLTEHWRSFTKSLLDLPERYRARDKGAPLGFVGYLGRLVVLGAIGLSAMVLLVQVARLLAA